MTTEQMLAKALKVLPGRGIRIEKRRAYYEGRHPTDRGSKAWNESFARQVAGIRDNQCRLVIEQHVGALGFHGVQAKAADAFSEVCTAWVNDRLEDEQNAIEEWVRHAHVTGEQAVIRVDYNDGGDVDFYPLDPASTYVELGRGGEYLWLVWLWRASDDAPMSATVETPTEVIELVSTGASVVWPAATDFHEVSRRTNVLGELSVAVVDKGGSIIDEIAPLNDLLNASLQRQFVAGESYVLPLRVWLGIDTYDPATGRVNQVMPKVNPATTGRDIAVPTPRDDEGRPAVEVQQFDSPEPSKFIADQDSIRLAIARLASIPGFILQLGTAMPVSGDALEVAYLPFTGLKAADERRFRPALTRMARLAVRRWLYAQTGIPADAPELRAVFDALATSTRASRMEEFTAAVAAGMGLADALVEFLGWDREAAETVQGHADAAKQAAADRAQAMYEQGVLGG